MTDNKVQYGVFQWGPCVMQIKISEEFRKLLLEESAKARKQANDYRSKLAGIIKEEYSFENKEKFLPWISQCLGIYDEAFQKFKNVRYKSGDKPKYLLSAMWVNYMKKHEFNPPHDHSDDLSFVAYLKVPPEIKQEFKEYKGKSSGPGGISFIYGEGDRKAITYQAHFPEEKDFFIFPAWLKHYVAPFKADVERISVSGNIANQIPFSAIKPVPNDGK